MANETVAMLNPKDGKIYDVDAAAVPRVQKMYGFTVAAPTQGSTNKQAAAPTGPPPGWVERFGQGLGIPSRTSLPDWKDMAFGPVYAKLRELVTDPSIGSLGAWKQAGKQTLSALNPMSGRQQAIDASWSRYGQPGFGNKAAGVVENALADVPYGPRAAHAMETAGSGNFAGAFGEAIPAAAALASVSTAAPELAESPWVNQPVKSAVASMRGLGKTGEEIARKEYSTPKGEGGKAAQTHREVVEQHQKMLNDYMDDLGEYGEKKKEASAAESEASTKSKVLSQQGPVYQRLTAMADRVADNANNLWKRIRATNDARWNAWRSSMIDPDTHIAATADLGAVRDVISSARQELLNGPSEDLRAFDNAIRKASPKNTAFIDTTPAGGMADMEPAISPSTHMPVDELHDFSSSLGGSAYDMEGGFARKQLLKVQEAADKEVGRVSAEHGQGKIYNRLKSDYAQYARGFLDHSGPFYKLLRAVNPQQRLDVIIGDTGRALTDSMKPYANDYGLNQPSRSGQPTPIELVEQTRSIQNQVNALTKRAPEVGDKPTLPPGAGTPPTPNVPGFDPYKWRLQQIDEQARRFVNPTIMEASRMNLLTSPFRRAMGAIMHDPGFREWLGSYTTRGPQFQPFEGPIPPASSGARPPPSPSAPGRATPEPPLPKDLPPMHPAEKAALEREVGYKFLSDKQAYEYLVMRTKMQAVKRMVEDLRGFRDDVSRRAGGGESPYPPNDPRSIFNK